MTIAHVCRWLGVAAVLLSLCFMRRSARYVLVVCVGTFYETPWDVCVCCVLSTWNRQELVLYSSRVPRREKNACQCCCSFTEGGGSDFLCRLRGVIGAADRNGHAGRCDVTKRGALARFSYSSDVGPVM